MLFKKLISLALVAIGERRFRYRHDGDTDRTGVCAKPLSQRAVSPGNTNVCDINQQSYVNNAICPAFAGTAQLFDFYGDDAGEYFDQ